MLCEKVNRKTMSVLIEKILPGVTYEGGFRINGKTGPYYSFCRPDGNFGWSDDMAEVLEEPTRNHFIDIYNRRVAIEGVKAKLSGGSCYLDMGCSSGYLLEEVLKRFPGVEAIGADYFKAGLLQCHSRLPQVPLFQDDLVNCKFPGNIFDVVTCLNVLEHIQYDNAAIKQLFRILKPGGVLAVTVPMHQGLYDIYDDVHGHCRRYALGELQDKFEAAGFKVKRLNYFGVFVFGPFCMVKLVNKIRYRNISESQKKKIVINQIKETERFPFMDKLCEIEYSLGLKILYPFGIRGYAIAVK